MLPYNKMWEDLKGQLQYDYDRGRIRRTVLTLIEVIEGKYSKEVPEPVVSKEPEKKVSKPVVTKESKKKGKKVK